MANIVFRLLGNIVELANTFGRIALSDPLSTVLLAAGVVVVLFSVCVFGYLAAGAFFSAVIPKNIGRTPPQRGE